MVLTRGVTYPL